MDLVDQLRIFERCLIDIIKGILNVSTEAGEHIFVVGEGCEKPLPLSDAGREMNSVIRSKCEQRYVMILRRYGGPNGEFIEGMKQKIYDIIPDEWKAKTDALFCM